MANEECDSSNDCPKIQKCVQVHGVCRYGSKKCKNNQECIHPDICMEGKCVDKGVHPILSNSSESGKVVKPEPKPSMNTRIKLLYVCDYFREKNQDWK